MKVPAADAVRGGLVLPAPESLVTPMGDSGNL